MRTVLRIFFALFVAIVPWLTCEGQQRSVALTFDDLPIVGTTDPAIVNP